MVCHHGILRKLSCACILIYGITPTSVCGPKPLLHVEGPNIFNAWEGVEKISLSTFIHIYVHSSWDRGRV